MSEYTKEEMEAAARNSWNASKEIREEFNNNFETYFAFREADANGQVKILSQKVTG